MTNPLRTALDSHAAGVTLSPSERAAVRAFQAGHGSLMVTGRLDPRTRAALRFMLSEPIPTATTTEGP